VLFSTSAAMAQNQVPLQTAAFSLDQPVAPAQLAAPPIVSRNRNSPAQAQLSQKKDDRMFYVMPNFLTVENEAQEKPLTWKGKFAVTADGAFDPYEFVIAGILTETRQAQHRGCGTKSRGVLFYC